MHLLDLRRELRQDLLGRHLVGVGRRPSSRRSRRTCREDTDVRVLDLLVQDEIDRVAALRLLHGVRHLAERDQVWRPVQRQAVFQRQALAALDLLPDGDQAPCR